MESNDNYKGNDCISSDLLIYKTSYPHKVLCEHFTTLACYNSPVGHDALAQIFKGKDNNVWMAHHIGYYTDELTQQAFFILPPAWLIGTLMLTLHYEKVRSLRNL